MTIRTTPSSTKNAAAIVAHSLGVRLGDPAGIFDEWHRREVASLRLEMKIHRDLMDEYEIYIRGVRASRQCWILAALIFAGMFGISVWAR